MDTDSCLSACGGGSGTNSFWIGCGQEVNIPSGTARSFTNPFGTEVESTAFTARNILAVQAATHSKLKLDVRSNASTSGDDCIVDISVEGVQSAVQIPIPFGATGKFEDDSNSVVIAEDARISYAVDASNYVTGQILIPNIVHLVVPS